MLYVSQIIIHGEINVNARTLNVNVNVNVNGPCLTLALLHHVSVCLSRQTSLPLHSLLLSYSHTHTLSTKYFHL